MNAIDHEWLVERFTEREERDPLTNAFAYVTGRIDEFCAQNAISDDERQRAARAAASRMRSAR